MPKTKAFDEHLEEYEDWFVQNQFAFRSEVNAIRQMMPENTEVIEVGVGSGLFAEKLGIKEGIEPSAEMGEKARRRGIHVIRAVGENLPYPDKSKEAVLMVTTVCFLDDVEKAFHEVNRVLKDQGVFLLAFVDKDSQRGEIYLKHKHENIFYRDAVFYSTNELHKILLNTGFNLDSICQTVFGKLENIKKVQNIVSGHGRGGFVVLKALKI